MADIEKVSVEINCLTNAFDGREKEEIADCLERLASRIRSNEISSSDLVFDSNMCVAGRVEIDFIIR